MKKLYPDSGVELTPSIARYYDSVMNIASVGLYGSFIGRAVKDMDIRPDDKILDLGCGTGRNAVLMAEHLVNGSITGLDISVHMERQFNEKAKRDARLKFINQRIDIQFDLGQLFDKVFISFVIHGLPHEIRAKVIENALTHLRPGGSFLILDFAEFDMGKMPWLHRSIFKAVECKYAFDFIEKDWKNILGTKGFGDFKEHLYLKNYVRLLRAVKNG